VSIRQCKVLCYWQLQNTIAPVALVLPIEIAGDIVIKAIIRACMLSVNTQTVISQVFGGLFLLSC
jgi:hypothetical protein